MRQRFAKIRALIFCERVQKWLEFGSHGTSTGGILIKEMYKGKMFEDS
jgi:hypothetical protein